MRALATTFQEKRIAYIIINYLLMVCTTINRSRAIAKVHVNHLRSQAQNGERFKGTLTAAS